MLSFPEFVEKKTRTAGEADIPPLRTIETGRCAAALKTVGNAWTRERYNGDFHLFDPPAGLPAMSLTFVQSRDGNTGADNPGELGGGPVDKHLIYEGLSRVAADAVLAGASTAVGPDVFFSVWHPELVALRRDLGLPRHPAQVVISKNGHLDFDALLFNVPEVPVFLVAGEPGERSCATIAAHRPWITVVRLAAGGTTGAFSRLRTSHGLSRISVVGGRSTASTLIDAGLVQDLCLTTTALETGEASTPLYTGARPPVWEVVVKKEGMGDTSPIVFEHLVLRS